MNKLEKCKYYENLQADSIGHSDIHWREAYGDMTEEEAEAAHEHYCAANYPGGSRTLPELPVPTEESTRDYRRFFEEAKR